MILIPGFYSPYYPSAVSHSCRSVLKGKLLLSSSQNCTSFRWEFGAERGSKDCLLQTVNLLLSRAVPECTASCSQKEQSYVCAVLFCSVKVLFPHHPERRNYFRKNGNIPANLSEIASLAKKKKKKSPACAIATFAGALVVQKIKCTKTLCIYIYVCI